MTPRTLTAGAAIAALLVTTAPALAVPTYEELVLTLTNAERTAVGCPVLTPNAQLETAAREHNDEMARTGNLSHTGADGSTVADRVAEEGYHHRLVAENIAAGQTSADEAVRAWLDSAAHRANIVNCELRDIGVAYAVDAHNTPYWTQDFGVTG